MVKSVTSDLAGKTSRMGACLPCVFLGGLVTITHPRHPVKHRKSEEVFRVWVWGVFFSEKKKYFTSSDPHHDMLGGGCQVRVVIENMIGRI